MGLKWGIFQSFGFEITQRKVSMRVGHLSTQDDENIYGENHVNRESCVTAAWLAQLVGRQSAVREVEGSSPRPDQHSGS